MIGRRLGHYEIVELLGKGGMGEVYRAHDTRLKRDVALKILPAEMADDPAWLERFQREAEAVASLNHPHIVTVHSVEEHEGVRFLVMELVDGVGLDEMVDANIPAETVLDLGISIARALAMAHEKGIVHRDLKPANVMVTSDDWVKVLDFGLAQSTKELPSDADETQILGAADGAIAGTVPYMSPEQLRGQQVGARSDVFSLGILLYELATGRRPFEGDSSADVISSILKETPPPVTDLRPDLPPALHRILARCMEKEPGRRYGHAGYVLAELEDLRRSLASGSGRVDTGAATAPRGPGGKRARWGIAAAGVAVVAIALAFLLGRDTRRGPEPPPPAPVTPAAAAPADPRSIAVMAFADMSAAHDQAYFSDGIADEVLNLLARVPDLKVISRSSAFLYKGRDVPLTQVGRELGVASILEGSVRSDGPHVRITVRLIDAVSDTQRWTETYDRLLDDIFTIQQEIALDVVEHLKVELLGEEAPARPALSAGPTRDVAAYRAYLQGMQHFNDPSFSAEASEAGIRMFERAISLDPEFALAYARLSSIRSLTYHSGYDRTAGERARAKEAVDRALELAPDLPEVHLALGHWYYWCERDYGKALAALADARKLAPQRDEILLATAFVARRQGDFAAAIQALEDYRKLSPLDPIGTIALGETYGTMRRYADAERTLQRAIAIAPDDTYPYTELAFVHLRRRADVEAARTTLAQAPGGGREVCRMGMYAELLDRRYDAALARLDDCPTDVWEAAAFHTPRSLSRGLLYRLQGRADDARAAFEAARAHLEGKLAKDDDDYRLHAALGITLAGLDRKEEAVRHARRAVALFPLAKDAIDAPVLVTDFALTLAMTGDATGAIEQLDLALSIPSLVSTAWLEADPRWDGLRGDPAFAELLRRHRGD